MRRNFGWTAIPATWAIFLILNSSSAGERTFSDPRNGDEHTSHKVQGTMLPAFDGKTTDRPALQRIKENFKSNDRSSMHAKAVSAECKNTENPDLRLSDYEKGSAMSNTVTASRYFKDSDGRNVWSTTQGEIVTENALSKPIAEKPRKRAKNYRKFGSNSRASPSASEKLKAAPEVRHKTITTYVFSNGRKNAAAIRRDTQAFDKKGNREWWKRRKRRRISDKYETTAFLPDEFPKRSQREKNDPDVRKMQNHGAPRLGTTGNIEFGKVDVKRERNKNEGDPPSRLEPTKNGANNKLIRINNGSQTWGTTSPSHSSSKEDQNRENVEAIMSVTDGAEDSTYGRSANAAWTTLIADSEISNANDEVVDDENAISSYRFPKDDENPRSYKPDEFPATVTYKLRGHSEGRVKINADARGNRKEYGDNIDSFTFYVRNPRGSRLAGEGGIARRSSPSKERHALRVARDTGPRHAYRSSSNNIHGEIMNSEGENSGGSRPRSGDAEAKRITGDADCRTRNIRRAERDLLSGLSSGRIDGTKLDTYPGRISVTPGKNPMHVRHVGPDADCERSRATDLEAGAGGAFRISLRNVSGLSSAAKFGGGFPARKNHNRAKYPARLGAVDITTPTTSVVPETRSDEKSRLDEGPEKTSIVSEFTSFDVTNVGDDLEETRMINERAQFASKFTDESVLENVRAETTSRMGNRRGAREGSKIYSPSGDVGNSKYRRNKRHEVRDALGDSASARLGATPGSTPSTANLPIKFTASPSVSTTQPSDAAQASPGTGGLLAATETLPFSMHQNVWRSLITGERNADSGNFDSPTMTPINAPKTLNASSRETTSPVSLVTLERSTTTAEIDNFVTPDPSDGNARVFDLAGKNVFTVSSTIEAINSHGAEPGFASTIDSVPQRSGLPPRDVLANDSSTADDVLLEQWPVKHSAVVEGDLVLGGLMMVHEREDNITCGPVMPQGGVQALEAMLYTLDTINDRGIVPGVKIGAHILDDCDKDTYGLEMAVDFIKGIGCR